LAVVLTRFDRCDWMDPTMKRLLMQQVVILPFTFVFTDSISLISVTLLLLLLHHHQVHRFLSSAFSSSMSSARPLHASTKTDIASALQRVLSLITEHRKYHLHHHHHQLLRHMPPLQRPKWPPIRNRVLHRCRAPHELRRGRR
jgi:hypothetical protein